MAMWVALGLAACAPEGEMGTVGGDESGSGTGEASGGSTAGDDEADADGSGDAPDTAGSAGGGGTGGGSAGGGSGASGPGCGNGILDADEECDLAVFDEAVCDIDGATLVCRDDCTVEPATCCAPSGATCIVALNACCDGCNGLLGQCN